MENVSVDKEDVMRKKSHISLAKHIVQISDIKNFDEHKKAFYILLRRCGRRVFFTH